jgi:hypothetical protein
VYFNGGWYTVTSLRIDTIDNLPTGLCWASNKPDNTYANQESGCIKVNGVPCGPTGQYKMRIIVTVNLGFGSAQVNADQAGLKYYIRLKNNGDATTPIDTFQTAANPFIAYGGTCPSVLPLNAYLGTDQTVCNGSVSMLSPLVSGGTGPYTYAWSSTGNSPSCNNCANPTITVTQNSTVMVTVTDANNNTDIDTVAYSVIGANTNFGVTASGSLSFCQGNLVTLTGAANGGYTYQWLKNNTNINGATANALPVASTGDYMLLYTNANCYAVSNVVHVNVDPRPDASVTQQPLTACQGDTIHLTAQADTSVHYFQWYYNNTAASASANQNATGAGNYQVVVRNNSNCYDTTSVAVSFKPLPQVTLNGNADTLCGFGSNLTLINGTPAGGTYSGAGVTGSSFSPSAAGLGVHTVSYTYTDTASCSNTSTETIVVVSCTGIDDVDVNGLQLYPNPVKKELTVEIGGTIVQPAIRIFDAAGRLQTANYTLFSNKIVIDTHSLPAGIYMLHLATNGSTLGRKFVKVD